MEELLVPVQKGALSEVAVSNAITLLTNGRLHCARPQPDDHGEDYRVYQRGFPASLPVQIKASYSADPFGGHQFLLDLRDLPKDARYFDVICVLGKRELPGIERTAWAIPGSVFVKQRRSGSEASFKLYPRQRRTTKYDRYRVDLFALGAHVVARLGATAEYLGRPLPSPGHLGLSRIFEGKVGEDAVAHLLMMGSEGRLAVFRPMADSIGLDLIAMSQTEGVRMAAQVKTRFVPSPTSSLSIAVPEITFRARADRIMVFVPYLRAELTAAPVLWAVPSVDFLERARRKDGKLVFAAAPRKRANDEWSDFQVGHEALAGLFERQLARRGRANRSSRSPGRR